MDDVNQPQGHAPQEQRGWNRSRRLRWGAGIAAAALLAAGGTVGGLKLAGPGRTPASAAQAAALNTALTSPAQGCASPANVSARGGKSSRRHCLRVRLRQVKGMYGQVALRTTSGTQTLAFERGTVVSSGGNRLTVRAANGTQWSWNLASSPVIRQSGKTVPAGKLTAGARVFVGGQVTGGTRNARLVVIHGGRKRPGTGSSAGSPGHSSSGGSSSGAAA